MMTAMGKRRDKLWRWRCQWSIVTLAAVALVVYNGVANVWLLGEPRCVERPLPLPTEPASCEPCLDTPALPADEDPLTHLDLRLGRWDYSRTYRFFDYAVTGDAYADTSTANHVCLATQTSIDRMHEILRIAAHWSGPISVAIFVVGSELKILRGFTTWLFYCKPEVYSRLAIHLAFPAERPGLLGNGNLSQWAKDCTKLPLPPEARGADSVQWQSKHAYPQNHLRNIARKSCHTPYVFLVDIDIVPSKGMTEALNEFLRSVPKCPLCAYVVPTYELDRRVMKFPSNKSELLRLSRLKLAVPFHKKVFIYNQFASNFTRWEMSGGNESELTHVSHNVTNFEILYEPFYVAPDTVPAHDERFVGYGFTRNTQPRGRRIPRVMMEAQVPVVPHWLCRLSYGDALTTNMFCGGHFLIGGVSSCQVYEMFMMGYQFRVLSPIFTIHWGLQSRRFRPLWREKQNAKNRKHFDTFKRELFARCHPMVSCSVVLRLCGLLWAVWFATTLAPKFDAKQLAVFYWYRKDPLHVIRKPPPPKKAT